VRFLKANKIFNGFSFLDESNILVITPNGKAHEIVRDTAVDPLNVESFDGILCPGFINAHCHLELSHLKERIPEKIGLIDFALKVITYRHQVSDEAQIEEMRLADKNMQEQGIVGVGDICNSDLSTIVKKESPISYHSFVELIGLNPQRSQMIFNHGLDLLELFKIEELSASLSPHAPYSVSLPLMKLIRLFNLENHLVSSIHFQESAQENLFFKGNTSDFHRLYSTLQIDISWFEPNFPSSFNYFSSTLEKPYQQLLVHNTFCDETTITEIAKTNSAFCFCPLANLYIENHLPNFDLFNGDHFLVGTDSLASNHHLNILDELNCILAHSNYSLEQCLKAATSNGAAFLKMPHLGSFDKGKIPGVNLITEKNRHLSFVKKVI
jgi:aminodeoxyfutalosine deaminase